MTSKRLQEIERLYHAAREKDPGEREAFLEKACGGDESLRKRGRIASRLPVRGEGFYRNSSCGGSCESDC